MHHRGAFVREKKKGEGCATADNSLRTWSAYLSRRGKKKKEGLLIFLHLTGDTQERKADKPNEEEGEKLNTQGVIKYSATGLNRKTDERQKEMKVKHKDVFSIINLTQLNGNNSREFFKHLSLPCVRAVFHSLLSFRCTWPHLRTNLICHWRRKKNLLLFLGSRQRRKRTWPGVSTLNRVNKENMSSF